MVFFSFLWSGNRIGIRTRRERAKFLTVHVRSLEATYSYGRLEDESSRDTKTRFPRTSKPKNLSLFVELLWELSLTAKPFYLARTNAPTPSSRMMARAQGVWINTTDYCSKNKSAVPKTFPNGRSEQKKSKIFQKLCTNVNIYAKMKVQSYLGGYLYDLV